MKKWIKTRMQIKQRCSNTCLSERKQEKENWEIEKAKQNAAISIRLQTLF